MTAIDQAGKNQLLMTARHLRHKPVLPPAETKINIDKENTLSITLYDYDVQSRVAVELPRDCKMIAEKSGPR